MIKLLLFVLVLSFTCEAGFAYAQNIPVTQNIPGSDDEYDRLIKEANEAYDSHRFTEAKELYQQALSIKPDSKLPKYKLQDIKTMQELLQIVENFEKVAVATGTQPIIKNEVIDKSITETKATSTSNQLITDNTVDKLELINEIKETETTSIIEPKIEKEEVVEEVVELIPEKEEEPVKKKIIYIEEEPEVEEIDIEEAYAEEQKRLLTKYPKTKTVEQIDNDTRKVTRIIINDGKKVVIYLCVRYSWGATYYYIDESPKAVTQIDKDEFYKLTE